MTQTQMEYITAGLRAQIISLQRVVDEVATEQLEPDTLGWRLRAVELSLRKLREAA